MSYFLEAQWTLVGLGLLAGVVLGLIFLTYDKWKSGGRW